jgi:hypothetical protein
MRRRHRVLESIARSLHFCATYYENHDRGISKSTSTVADRGDHSQNLPQRGACGRSLERELTGHDNNTSRRIRRSDQVKQRQRKVCWDVEETPDPEHLQVRELAQRRTEAGI